MGSPADVVTLKVNDPLSGVISWFVAVTITLAAESGAIQSGVLRLIEICHGSIKGSESAVSVNTPSDGLNIASVAAGSVMLTPGVSLMLKV